MLAYKPASSQLREGSEAGVWAPFSIPPIARRLYHVGPRATINLIAKVTVPISYNYVAFH
jgi:hypothetical protein